MGPGFPVLKLGPRSSVMMTSTQNHSKKLLIKSCLASVFFGFSVTACSTDTLSPWPPEITSGSRLSVDCDSDGKVSQHHVSGVPVLVVCRGEDDLERLEQLDDYVFQPGPIKGDNRQFRSVRQDVFIAVGISPHSRCTLEFVPEDGKWTEIGWPGGFHSLCRGEVFDMAGRQIKPGPFSPTNFQNFIGNLFVPEYRFVSDTEVEFK